MPSPKKDTGKTALEKLTQGNKAVKAKAKAPEEDRSLRSLLKRVDREADVLDAALKDAATRSKKPKPPPLKVPPALASLDKQSPTQRLQSLNAPQLPSPDKATRPPEPKTGSRMSLLALAAGTVIGLPIIGFAAYTAAPQRPGTTDDSSWTRAPATDQAAKATPASPSRVNLAQATGTLTLEPKPIPPASQPAPQDRVIAPAPQPAQRSSEPQPTQIEPTKPEQIEPNNSVANPKASPTNSAAIPSEPPPASAPPVMPATPTVQLSLIKTVKVRGGDRLALPLRLDPPDGAPTGSTLIVNGLPPGYSLTAASPGPDNTWVLVPDAIGLSHLIVPTGADGEVLANVTLLDTDGHQLASGIMRIIATPKHVVRKIDAEKLASMVTRAEILMSSGAIAEARLLYERAAEAGSPDAAFALGESFDPVLLNKRGVFGLKGDNKKALLWYERAHQQGIKAAAPRMRRLLSATAQ